MWQSTGDRIKQRQREREEQAQPSTLTEKPLSSTVLSLAHYQTAMSVDLAKLSAIKVMEERQRVKVNLLETYREFVWDYVEQGHNYPNDVAVHFMIWLFDVEDIEPALKLAFYLMPHQQMPERFNRRDIQTFVCDGMYDWAKAKLDDNKTALPLIDEVVAKLDSWELSPPVASKVLVMAAKHHNAAEHFNTVVEYLEKAKTINPDGWGAKTLLTTAKART